jgi:EAL domain-containing protein (putative c-di-GMP-specific phosphodiesterase class I)
VITVAKTLNLSVTAEGIETLDQLQELRALNCDQGQGYYFARPEPSLSVERLFERLRHEGEQDLRAA